MDKICKGCQHEATCEESVSDKNKLYEGCNSVIRLRSLKTSLTDVGV